MTRETFYFKHDCNARADRKLVNVRMRHGLLGIGLYWCLVEMLYEEGGYLPFEYERISFELGTNKEITENIIKDFELFKFDEKRFWSESVLERLQERCDKSEKARHSINKRWNKLGKHTNVIRPESERNTKEKSIVKNKREKNIFIKPSIEEINNFCQERNNNVDPEKWFNYYESNGWLIGKNKMKNWKAAIITWEKNTFNNPGGNQQKLSCEVN